MTYPLATAGTGLVIGVVGGWLMRMLYEAQRNRPRLEARLYVTMVEHEGQPKRYVIRFEITNNTRRSVVTTSLEI